MNNLSTRGDPKQELRTVDLHLFSLKVESHSVIQCAPDGGHVNRLKCGKANFGVYKVGNLIYTCFVKTLERP